MGGSEPHSPVDPVEDPGTPMMGRPVVPGSPSRDVMGFALVAVLLALMLLAGIATAAVVAAVGQVRAAGMAGRVLAGRAAARGGVERVLAEVRGRPGAAVGNSAVELMAGSMGALGSWRVYDLRLTREWHVLVAEADLGGGLRVRVRDARVVWWMDPESRVGTHRAVVESDSVAVAPAARILADSLLAGRRGVADCDSLPLFALAARGGLFGTAGGLPQPPEWGEGGDGADFKALRLGWFGRSMLAALADHNVSGGVTAPGCAGCWSGLVFGSGGIRVSGSGAGVLVVDGDLVLGNGSSWTGLVLVSGSVTFEPGSALLGLLRVGGGVTLTGNSVVDGSMCAALEALSAATSLARPIPMPARSWLGPVPPRTE